MNVANTPNAIKIPINLPKTKSKKLTGFDIKVMIVLLSISDAKRLHEATTAIMTPKKFKAPEVKSKINFNCSCPKSRRKKYLDVATKINAMSATRRIKRCLMASRKVLNAIVSFILKF